jgi:predicted DNA-binding protein YlxM (UPF0122 family)
MKDTKFSSLTPRQQYVFVLAASLRNAMEDFHVKYLSDSQMAELNPLIRQALYDAITLIEDNDNERRNQRIEYLVEMIPDYWESPKRSLPLKEVDRQEPTIASTAPSAHHAQRAQSSRNIRVDET